MRPEVDGSKPKRLGNLGRRGGIYIRQSAEAHGLFPSKERPRHRNGDHDMPPSQWDETGWVENLADILCRVWLFISAP